MTLGQRRWWAGAVSLLAGLAMAVSFALPSAAESQGADAIDAAPVDADLMLPQLRPTDVVASSTEQAQLLASALGEPVEDLSAKTATSAEFATGYGQTRVDQYFGDQFVDVDGQWQTLSTMLVADTDGWFSPDAYPRQLEVSAGGTDSGTVVRAAIAESNVIVEMVWNGPLPRVEISGPRAAYRNIAPGIDLVIDVLPSGFQHYFVVDSVDAYLAAAPLGLALAIEHGTVTGEAGMIEILDDSGAVVATVPDAWAWDAANDAKRLSPVLQPWTTEEPAATGGEDDPANSVPDLHPVTMSLTGDDESRLELTADEAWLYAPDTVFPIVVDPVVQTVSTSRALATAASVGPISTSYDTYIASSYPTSNWPTSDELRLGTWDGGASRYRSYINMPAGSMRGRDIVSAELHLYMWHSWSCTARAWQVSATGNAWSATTWNNPPAVSSAHTQSTVTKGYSSSCPDGDAEVDITNVAQYFAGAAPSSSTVWALRLRALDDTDNYAWKRFYSDDYAVSSKRPFMTYYYNKPPATPTNLTINNLSGSSPANPAVVTDPRPYFRADVSDPDGDPTSVSFALYDADMDDTEYTLNKTVTDTYVAPGDHAVVQNPTNMRWDHSYMMVAAASDGRLPSAASAPAYFVLKNSVPAVPSNLTVEGLSGSSGTPVEIDTALPTVSATVSDPDGTTTYAQFRIYRQNGQVLTEVNGSSVASGGTSTATVDVALEMGVQYYVTARAVDVEDAAYDGLSTRYSAYSGEPSWTFTRTTSAPNPPTGLLVDDATPPSGDVTYTGGRPRISAVVSDPQGGSVQVAVVVFENGRPHTGADQILGTVVTSGSRSEVTLPFSLVTGVRYTFEVFAHNGAVASTGVALPGTYSVKPFTPPDINASCDGQAAESACGGN